MAGKKKSKKQPKDHSKSTKSTIQLERSSLEDAKEQISPNEIIIEPNTKILESKVDSINLMEEKLLHLDNFKDWIEDLHDEDLSNATKEELMLVQQDLKETEDNLSYISNLLNPKHSFSLGDINESMKKCEIFKHLALKPDFYSKGPLKTDFIYNRLIALEMFKEAKTKFEVLVAYQLFTMNSSILSIQEQMILNKSGYLITCEMIRDASNKLVSANEKINKVINDKIDLMPVMKKLSEHENYATELESSLEGWIDEFQRKLYNLEINWNKNFDQVAINTLNENKKSEKLFGLIRKVNSRIQGLHDKIFKPDPPPENNSLAKNTNELDDAASKSNDSYEELENSEEEEEEQNEELEEIEDDESQI